MDRSIALWALCFLIGFVVMLVVGEPALAILTLLLLFAGLRLTGN